LPTSLAELPNYASRPGPKVSSLATLRADVVANRACARLRYSSERFERSAERRDRRNRLPSFDAGRDRARQPFLRPSAVGGATAVDHAREPVRRPTRDRRHRRDAPGRRGTTGRTRRALSQRSGRSPTALRTSGHSSRELGPTSALGLESEPEGQGQAAQRTLGRRQRAAQAFGDVGHDAHTETRAAGLARA